MAFSGTGAIREMAPGDYAATIFAGSGTGLTAAIAAGGKVSLGPGTFLIDTAIPLVSNLEIQGCGIGKTILKHSGTTLHTIFSGSSKSKIRISDLTIDGDQTGVSSYNADRWAREEAIDLATCTDFVLSNVEITASRGQAIYGTACSRVRIENCWIHDCDSWGSIFKASDDIAYVNNHLDTLYTHGLYVDSQTVAGGASRIKFIGNTVINVQFDSAHAASGVGISVQKASGTSGVYDVVCVGNVCKNNGAMGFSMTPGSRTSGYAGKMTIIGNHSEGHTAQSGIGYELIGSHITLSGNTAKNNKYHCTAQDSKGIVITGNKTISALGSSQIHYILTPATNADWVEDYTLDGNVMEGGTGFQIDSTATTTPHTNITVTGNEFVGCENGILFQVQPSNVVVSGNIVDNSNASVSVGRGMRLGGDNVVVANNQIKTKTTANAFEFHVAGTTGYVSMVGNMVTQSNYPLSFSQAVTTMYLSGNTFVVGTTGTFNAKNNVTNWRDGGTNSWNFGTAAPASEYWHVGTKVYDTAVAAAGNIGWVCTTAGTPGTWKTWGVVAA